MPRALSYYRALTARKKTTMSHPLLAPLFPAGKEPLPPGMTEEDRANMLQMKKYQDYMSAGMESCLGKTTMAGVFGTPALASPRS